MMGKITNRQPEETLKEALQAWAKAAPMTLKLQADLLGIPESTLANALNPNIDNMHYHLRWLIPHTLLLGDLGALDYLEACVGRVAFPLPEVPECVADLQAELARTIKEFGDVVTTAGQALEDGRILRNEVKRIEREIHELVRQALGFLQSVKDRMERF